MPFSQACFVFLSNYPYLNPLKQWLAGILLVFLPQSLWSEKLICICWQPDRKGGAQIPDLRAERVMNGGRVYLYFYSASSFPDQLHVTASQSRSRRNLLLSLLTLVFSAHVATEVGIYLYFPRFCKSCHLEDHALFLNAGFLCVSIQIVPCTFWSHIHILSPSGSYSLLDILELLVQHQASISV